MVPLFNSVKADLSQQHKINVDYIYHNDMSLSELEVCVTVSLRKNKGIAHCKKFEITVRLIRWVFARVLHNAWLLHCSLLCGGAPAAWCQAKGSSRLMWVTPAATGLWFISLGMETRTLQSLQDSQLALEAVDITENIKLLYRADGLKWKLECLFSHAFALTPFLVPVLAFSHVLISCNPVFKAPMENDFHS